MILWIFAFAYGRMTETLDWKPFVILAAISAVLAYVFPSPFRLGVILEFACNIAGFYSLFMAGYGFGTWRRQGERAEG